MGKAYRIREVMDLGPGDHLCCIYSTEEEHRALLTPYLRQGLERNHKVLYIVDARTAEDILGYLADDGLEVELYLSSGQLAILTSDEAYMKEGAFDPEGMIRLLTEETELALSEGYSALRVTGEMTWALRGLPGSERLMEYEAKLNHFFPGSACLAICQYDRRRFPPEMLLDVLTTHPMAVIGTQIYENFYYIHPDEYLSNRLPQSTLEHWIGNLEERKASSEALRESEEKYRLIVDNAQEGIWTIDSEAATTFVNRRMAEMLGYSVEEMLGRSLFDFMDDAGRERALYYLERRRRGISEQHDFEFMRKDGSRIYVSMETSPILDDQDNFSAAIAFVADVSERKQSEDELRETRDYLDNLIQYANAPIIVWDPYGQITRFNRAFEFMTGYEAEEVLGRDLDILFPESSRGESITKIGLTLAGEYWESVEIPILRKDGQVRMALWNSANIYGEDGTTLLATVAQGQDITERKNADEELRRYREHLEELVRERTLDLQRINEQLQQEIAERKRKEIELQVTAEQLRALSAHLQRVREEERRRIALDVHDKLGQALTGLKINLSLLGKRIAGQTDLEDMVEAMSDLVDDTIKSIREISTELRPGVLDDLGLIAALDWQLQRFEEMTGIKYNFDVAIKHDLQDKDLSVALFRVAQEALTNIARHADATRVEVHLGEDGDCLILHVADDGRGVTREEISATESFGIMGMKERAIAFGGHVDIQGKEGKGTTLSVCIPLSRNQALGGFTPSGKKGL